MVLYQGPREDTILLHKHSRFLNAKKRVAGNRPAMGSPAGQPTACRVAVYRVMVWYVMVRCVVQKSGGMVCHVGDLPRGWPATSILWVCEWAQRCREACAAARRGIRHRLNSLVRSHIFFQWTGEEKASRDKVHEISLTDLRRAIRITAFLYGGSSGQQKKTPRDLMGTIGKSRRCCLPLRLDL